MITEQPVTSNHQPEWSPTSNEERKFMAEVADYADRHGLDRDDNLAFLKVLDLWEHSATVQDPSTEPCPVWCEQAGQHRWEHDLHSPAPFLCGRSSRVHSRTTVPGVEVLSCETDGEYDPERQFGELAHVQVDDWKIADPGEAVTFLRAVAEACAIAFPGLRVSTAVDFDIPTRSSRDVEEPALAPRPKGSDLLTMADVAGITGFHVQTLYKWSRLGDLPTVRIGRSVRVRRGDLEKWTVKHARRTR